MDEKLASSDSFTSSSSSASDQKWIAQRLQAAASAQCVSGGQISFANRWLLGESRPAERLLSPVGRLFWPRKHIIVARRNKCVRPHNETAARLFLALGKQAPRPQCIHHDGASAAPRLMRPTNKLFRRRRLITLSCVAGQAITTLAAPAATLRARQFGNVALLRRRRHKSCKHSSPVQLSERRRRRPINRRALGNSRPPDKPVERTEFRRLLPIERGE